MSENNLVRLSRLGQSVWLDYIRRSLVRSGELAGMIEHHALAGMTSNPAIFEKAIGGSDEYDEDIATLADEGLDADAIYQQLALDDVRAAADVFRGTYEEARGRDGFVSLEVSPHLARDTSSTSAQATELWRALDRPNVMIKVPGTEQGLPAIEALTREGINVNVTLLFSVERYRQVADAFLRGLEARAQSGRPLEHVASVASFFVSRVDTAVDRRLEERDADRKLRGRAAIANARLAYAHYREMVESARWRTLSAAGAQPQRLLWASTSTKNPDYSDVMYVEELIGPETVNTMPPATLEAYLDHGAPEPRLTAGTDAARRHVTTLADLGIDLEEVAEELEQAGVEAFVEPFDKLLETVEQRRQEALADQKRVEPEA